MKTCKARLMVLLSAVLWSSGGLVAKVVTLRPLSLTFFRGVTGLVFLIVYIHILGKKPLASPGGPGRGAAGKKRIILILLGSAAYGCTSIFFFLSLRLTTAANATILQNTAPVWVAILGFLILGERPAVRHWLAIAAVIPGVALCMKGNFTFTGNLGNAVALSSGICFSFLVIIMRLLDERSSLQAIAGGTLLTVIVSTPSAFADLSEGALTGRDVLLTSLLGVFQFAVPFVMYNRALPWMKAVESTILRLLEPVLISVWVALIVGEVPGRNTLAGGVLVLTVLILLVTGDQRKPRRTIEIVE